MSGIAHAVKSVFHGIVNVWHKVWKPLVIAAAVYFTGGLAGAWALPGAAAADAGAAGAAAASGGLTVDAGAAGLTADAATDAAIGAGATDAGTAAAGIASSGVDSALAGAGVDSGLGASSASSLGNLGQIGDQWQGIGDVTSGMSALPVDSTAASAGMAPSSMWGSALDTAGKIMKFPGVMQGISGLLNGYQQGEMMNQQLAWQEAHAPGQIQGGVKGAFNGFATNQNLQGSGIPRGNFNLTPEAQAAHNEQRAGSAGMGNPAPGAPGLYGQAAYSPGMNDPYAQSSAFPGYGLPGFGVQGMGQQPSYYQQLAQQGLLGEPQQPFMDNPYGENTQPYYG